MDVYHHTGRDTELDGLLDRVSAGETVEIVRDGKPVAVLTPPQTAAASMDWDALKALTDSLPYDPHGTVAEMRRAARY